MTTAGKLLEGLETRYKVNSLLSPAAMVGEVLMEVFIPLIMANIIDIGIAGKDIGYVAKVGLLMIAVSLFSLLCGMLSARFGAVGALGFARNLRRRLFSKVQDFSFANVDKFSTASLVTRLTTDINNAQNMYMMIIRMCVRAPMMLISATIMSFIVNRSLAVVFLGAIPLIVIPMIFIMKAAFPRFKIMMKRYDTLNSAVQENLTGIRVVKAFVRENHESQKFRDAADAVRSAQVKAEKLVILGMPLMQMVMYVSIIVIFWFGGNMIIGGTLLTGQLISFITYLSQILISLMMLSMIFVMLVISRASIIRIVEVLDEQIDIANPVSFSSSDDSYSLTDKSSAVLEKKGTGSVTAVKDGSIDFKNVFFSYAGTQETSVLNDVSFSIPTGATIGIIGGTGSSKTTLVQLIPRLYDVLSGSVMVGGVDVKEYDLEALRSSVAMVLQKNVLFTGTIKENLLWGNEKAGDDELIQACKTAHAHDFIMSFPEGYETVLGQGGVNVSGGQKQRLCIARALLKSPKILILDDSTSAVDTATDTSIRTSLKETLADTTKIIIAQRIASVKEADIIFVLDEGKLTAQGTHDELLSSSSIYREVYDSQKSGSAVDLDIG
ncbi:MAG TPA: ABC transporter ATP-binding protein [Treponemataceae bacterium]|jgi:ATP-binding cassette subfamily B protein|nr:ABC transporter ATP-binding protein [Treponemataceae bacterium]